MSWSNFGIILSVFDDSFWVNLSMTNSLRIRIDRCDTWKLSLSLFPPRYCVARPWALPHTHPEYRPAHSQQKKIAVAQQLCLTLVEHVSAFKIMRGTREELFLQGMQWETTDLMDISIHNHIYCLFFGIRCCPHDVHVLLAINWNRDPLKVFQKIQVTGPGGNPLMCTAVDGISPSPGHAPVAPGTPAAPMEGGPSLAYRLESQHTARRCWS